MSPVGRLCGFLCSAARAQVGCFFLASKNSHCLAFIPNRNCNPITRLISRTYTAKITANDKVLSVRYFTVTLVSQLAM